MTRLTVVLLSLALLAPPLAAEAQPAGKVARIGFCDSSGEPRRVWLTGSIPWEPHEGSGRLAAKLAGGS